MRKLFSASAILAGCLVGLLQFGCLPPPPPPPPPLPPPPPGAHVITGDSVPPAQNDSGPSLTSTGAMAPLIYKLQMPFGANSRDNSFWKLVDEDVVDVPTEQRLVLNGIRVGRGKVADWPTYLKILTNEEAIKTGQGQILAQTAYGDAKYPMTDTIPEELLFIYDEHGLTMRSFNNCANEFSMAFDWAPRKPRTIRITICPVVEAMETRSDFSMSDNPPPVRVLDRENFYHLNLRADIAPGEFMILGTSPETADENRVGSRFLTLNGPSKRFEEVLIIVGDSVPMVPMRYHPKVGPQESVGGASTRQSN
jgi:hypothetical protein